MIKTINLEPEINKANDNLSKEESRLEEAIYSAETRLTLLQMRINGFIVFLALNSIITERKTTRMYIEGILFCYTNILNSVTNILMQAPDNIKTSKIIAANSESKEAAPLDNQDLVILDKMTLIFGKSEHGKSTLSKKIAGLEKTNANILIGNVDLRKIPKENFTYIPENSPLFKWDMLWENIVFFRKLNPVQEATATNLIKKFWLIVENDLEKTKQRSVTQLSDGEKKRMILIRGLISLAPILILDEPTSLLDNKFRQIFIDHLREIEPTKSHIIIITHDLDFIDTYNHFSIIFVNSGKIHQGTHADLLLEEAYKTFCCARVTDLEASTVESPKTFSQKQVAGAHLRRKLQH